MVLHFFKLIFCLWVSIVSVSIHATERMTDIFDSLPKIEQYAQYIAEYPHPDNTDWENPNFSTYYEDLNSNKFYKTLKQSSGTKPLWSLKGFKSLLEQVTTMRRYNG